MAIPVLLQPTFSAPLLDDDDVQAPPPSPPPPETPSYYRGKGKGRGKSSGRDDRAVSRHEELLSGFVDQQKNAQVCCVL